MNGPKVVVAEVRTTSARLHEFFFFGSILPPTEEGWIFALGDWWIIGERVQAKGMDEGDEVVEDQNVEEVVDQEVEEGDQ